MTFYFFRQIVVVVLRGDKEMEKQNVLKRCECGRIARVGVRFVVFFRNT